LHCAKLHIQVRDGIIKTEQAQIVLQNLHIGKLQQSLKFKEQKKETEHTKLFPGGKGRHLTGQDFMEAVERSEEAQVAKATAQKKRKDCTAKKKAAKVKAEERWKKLLDQHALTVTNWEIECKQLTEEGVPKSHLPKKPLCPKKPEIELESERSESDNEED